MATLTRKPINPEAILSPGTEGYDTWLNELTQAGLNIANSIPRWQANDNYHNGTVRAFTLPSSHAARRAKEDSPGLSISSKELWAARRSLHYLSHTHPSNQFVHDCEVGEMTGSESSSGGEPSGIYEAFEKSLLRDHTRQESEYIDSLQDVDLVETFDKGRVEMYRMGYAMPSPLSPRTFLAIIITQTLPPIPAPIPPQIHIANPSPPFRQFIVITLPTTHSSVPEKTGSEKGRVRGRYVSVELVREVNIELKGFEHGSIDGGSRSIRGVEWLMATSSDAGGNVPQALTSMSLPGKITEDVPLFISWLEKKYPHLGKVGSKKF